MGNIYGNGMSQSDLKTLLDAIITNFNAMNAVLDADTGVSGTNYASLWNMTATSVLANGMNQGDLISTLQNMIDCIAGVDAKLDAESLTDSDYATTCDVTDTVNATANYGIFNNGMAQGCVVKLLNTIITNFNALLAKLAADGTVNGTTAYTTLTITDTIDETGTSNTPGI